MFDSTLFAKFVGAHPSTSRQTGSLTSAAYVETLDLQDVFGLKAKNVILGQHLPASFKARWPLQLRTMALKGW